MSSLQRKSFVVGGCVLLYLAGCAKPPAAVKFTPVSGAPVAATPAPPPMPSYPILLVDLPRQQMGQPVAPARSRLPAGADRDLDSPGLTPTVPAPPSTRVTPHTAAPLAGPVSPLGPPAAPPARHEPIDTRYVP
jgi:hypothetical protein